MTFQSAFDCRMEFFLSMLSKWMKEERVLHSAKYAKQHSEMRIHQNISWLYSAIALFTIKMNTQYIFRKIDLVFPWTMFSLYFIVLWLSTLSSWSKRNETVYYFLKINFEFIMENGFIVHLLYHRTIQMKDLQAHWIVFSVSIFSEVQSYAIDNQ